MREQVKNCTVPPIRLFEDYFGCSIVPSDYVRAELSGFVLLIIVIISEKMQRIRRIDFICIYVIASLYER